MSVTASLQNWPSSKDTQFKLNHIGPGTTPVAYSDKLSEAPNESNSETPTSIASQEDAGSLTVGVVKEMRQDAVPSAPRLKEIVGRPFLQPLQEWEGYVCNIDEDDQTFTARLVDLTAGSQTEEEVAEFALEELSDANLALLKEGAVFRWVIGYLKGENGSKRRVSDIVFRRMPAWSKREIAASEDWARKMGDELLWE